jgi:hypothetical protein
MRSTVHLTLLVTLSGLAGCSDGGAGGGRGLGGGAPDSAPAAPDSAPPVLCQAAQYTPTPCGAHPGGPHGHQQGQVLGAFDPALKDCELKPVRLREISCNSRLLLLYFGAGWCQPCIEQMQTIEKELHRKFCGRGLGVVTVIYQDAQRKIPTSTYCGQWKQTFGLTFPVLLDQLGQTGKLLGSGDALPLKLLIDPRTFEVLRRITGGASGDLSAAIDAELKKLGR